MAQLPKRTLQLELQSWDRRPTWQSLWLTAKTCSYPWLLSQEWPHKKPLTCPPRKGAEESSKIGRSRSKFRCRRSGWASALQKFILNAFETSIVGPDKFCISLMLLEWVELTKTNACSFHKSLDPSSVRENRASSLYQAPLIEKGLTSRIKYKSSFPTAKIVTNGL